ncbi:tRNA lysidine(34) synthetase TilS [Sphingomonas naphthae]|uniref:tRNA(Ile)-lysidine synthase n=1 Tax=Sphingomonas naphthae TaxID=1813468 RepID=A0ABY7THV4_9SPHN|nr:tRNA lysidine(34) synthetase TilS [Sphingomonas naphthae]WCT71909.1 tRNA lysidine(34) synthetase TilS [Sphingomonas naphthae]
MIPPPDDRLVARFRGDFQSVRRPTLTRHPSESWGLSPPGERVGAGDPSFRWDDDGGEWDDGRKLALAVSGGPDSLALLLLAAHAFPGRVIAATVDHGLRAEAATEATAVAAICAGLAVPHITLSVTVAPGASVQAAARRARYAALEGWAVAAGATVLLTAHHLDDQAETILMRVARGAGIAGLAGIRPVRPLGRIILARPLLGWTKADLVAIAAAAGLASADDPSNRDPRFDRARARQLIAATPWLAPARLAALAPRSVEIEEALAYAAQAAEVRITCDNDGAIRLDPTGLPREITRRLLLAAIALADPESSPPRGPALDRLLNALVQSKIATLGRLRFAPGPPWRISRVPPHRSN